MLYRNAEGGGRRILLAHIVCAQSIYACVVCVSCVCYCAVRASRVMLTRPVINQSCAHVCCVCICIRTWVVKG